MIILEHTTAKLSYREKTTPQIVRNLEQWRRLFRNME